MFPSQAQDQSSTSLNILMEFHPGILHRQGEAAADRLVVFTPDATCVSL